MAATDFPEQTHKGRRSRPYAVTEYMHGKGFPEVPCGGVDCCLVGLEHDLVALSGRAATSVSQPSLPHILGFPCSFTVRVCRWLQGLYVHA